MHAADTIGFFDFARGVGILSVLISHSVSLFYAIAVTDSIGWNCYASLGAGVMAMFFLISGLGFQARGSRRCIRSQIRLYLPPYLITALCVIGAKAGLCILKWRPFKDYGAEFLFSYLLALNRGFQGTILGLPVNNVAMLWFLWALGGGWCIYNAICLVKDRRLRPALVSLCVLISFGMIHLSRVWPYALPQMLQAVGFLWMGHEIRERKLLDKVLPVWIYPLCMIPVFITALWGGVDIFTCSWKLGIWDYLSVCIMGFFLLRFFAWFGELEVNGRVYDWVSGVGTQTLLILCIHAFDEKVLPWHKMQALFAERAGLGILICLLIRIVFVAGAFGLVSRVLAEYSRIRRRKHKKVKLEIS